MTDPAIINTRKAASVLANQQSFPAARISESVFVEKFLPQLAQSLRPGFVLDLAEWINVAGKSTRPVDVIDANGKVVHRVPAIMNFDTPLRDGKLTVIDPFSGDTIEMSLNNATQLADKMNDSRPGSGARWINEQINANKEKDDVKTESWLTFVDIVKYYGIELPEDLAVADKPAEQNNGFDDDDFTVD